MTDRDKLRERVARAIYRADIRPFFDGKELERRVNRNWRDGLISADAALAEIAAAIPEAAERIWSGE